MNHTIQEIAYEKYKLSWMLSHGFTLSNLMHALHSYQEGVSPLPELFCEWETDAGFSGSLWVCFHEFLNTEYQNEEYMKTLLTEPEFIRYLAERTGES